MRRLDFSGEKGAQRYEVLYDGIMGSVRGFTAPSETRVIGRALTKLEAVGRPTQRQGVPTFELRPAGGAVVQLEEEEFNLMREALSQTRFTPWISRVATEVLDWFDAAPSK